MEHKLFMKRCFELAQRGKGYTSPNPMVGAVLVHNGRILAEGWHHNYGQDHAEVDCLYKVTYADKHLIPESTMYVSLEPCAHHGKTPPCAQRLVQEGIKTVVIANNDPFDQVNGKGVVILTAAGIEVETGLLENEGLWVNRRFFCFHKQQRPYIILKWAQTQDGYTAPADKTRFQITNNHSQQLVHKWRTEESAIIVGTTTALNDNPQLTARLWEGKQPLRIVLDRKLAIPPGNAIYNNNAPTWIINELKDETTGNIQFVKATFDGSLLDTILEKLYHQKTLSLTVEGGTQLLNSFISLGLWDEARIFTGNKLLKYGIAAPLLQHSVKALSTHIGDDSLKVFVNDTSPYQYVQGMEL
jgi:diaminohydroxyphosphoribosylaminopyrimidine deaminase/5-amino-6-(5-phosphoribosylamino)uracil reductase